MRLEFAEGRLDRFRNFWLLFFGLFDERFGIRLGGVVYGSGKLRFARSFFSQFLRVFLRLDLTRDPLPDGDLILCRDCLVHLPFEDVRRAVRNFKRSGARWLNWSAATTC